MSFSRNNISSQDSGFAEIDPVYVNVSKIKPPVPPKPCKSSNVLSFAKMFENIATNESANNGKSNNLDRKKSFSYLFDTAGTSKVSPNIMKPLDENIYDEPIEYTYERAKPFYEILSKKRLDKPLENSDDMNNAIKILSYNLQELISTETTFIEKLSNGINNYIKPLKNLRRSVYLNVTDAPKEVSPELLNIFMTIEELHNAHAQKLLPNLYACQNDLFNIAHIFYTYLTDDSFFDIYIRYACGRGLIDELVERHPEFFGHLARESNDRMQINSFMNVPSERLRQYKLLFDEIYKQLQKDANSSKDLVRAYLRLIERLSEQMRIFNDAFNLKDIENSKIDWSIFGRFKKMGRFKVKLTNDQFDSKVFMFTQNIIITKTLPNEKLFIMKMLNIQDIQYINDDSDDEFTIVTTENTDIQFLGEPPVVREWIQSLALDSDTGTLSINSEVFDESYALQSLRKMENYFKHSKIDWALLDFSSLTNCTNLIMQFKEAHNNLIKYHCTTIIPALENQITTIPEFCKNVQLWLNDPSFRIYITYAYYASNVLYFSMDHPILFNQLEPIVFVPLKHIKRYQKFFAKLMTRLLKTMNVQGNMDLIRDLMETVAKTSKDFSVFAKAVIDNFDFNFKICEYDYGIIQYSDLVTEAQNSVSYSLNLLEKAVVAVEIEKDENNDDNESFKKIKWTIPYSDVKFECCNQKPERIVFNCKESYERFSVIFRSVDRRKEFMRKLIEYF